MENMATTAPNTRWSW